MKTNTKNILVEIIAAMLILLFVYTAIMKLWDIDRFALTMSKSPLLGPFSNVLSFMIPVIEMVIAAMLFAPQWRTTGFKASFILMSVFTIYIAGMLLFASKLPCSCGGVIAKMSWGQHLVFNLLFVSLAFVGWRWANSKRISTAIEKRRSRTPLI